MGGGTLVARSGTSSDDIDDCDPVWVDGVSVCVGVCEWSPGSRGDSTPLPACNP